MPFRIYLVEDHPVMRQAYAGLFAVEDDLVLVGTAASAEDALRDLPDDGIDLLVTDLSLPGADGLALTRHLRASRPDLPVLVVSAQDEPTYVDLAHAAGATAYLSKDGLAGTLAPTVRKVLARGSAAWAGGPTRTRR
jgi:DNA-binding NarL/FixJ family response regulator